MGDLYVAAQAVVERSACEHRNALVWYKQAREALEVAKRENREYSVVRTYTENLRQADMWVKRCLEAYSAAVCMEIDAVGK